MLDHEKIKAVSAQTGLLEVVVEKDYVLDWILWGVSQSEYLRNRLIFKGGTALHKMYFADWRFSEDLDFTTVTQIEKNELEDAIKELCKRVGEQSGIVLRQKEMVVSGDQSSEWSIEEKIEYVGPRKQTGSPLPIIRLHITHDELLVDEPVTKMMIATYQDLPKDFAILSYSLEEILSEKIRTICHQRCWPRDIYDTWRLLREAKSFINVERVIDVYDRKCAYRGFDQGIPANIDERILRIKNQWKEGLQRQIKTPPDFEKVHPEVKDLLEKLFGNHATIKKGGFPMLEAHYTIRYRKGDLEIEVQGDKVFVEEKFKELLSLKPMGAQKEPTISPASKSLDETGKKVSLAEFLKTKNLKSHGDKILAFGYFLEKAKGFSSFNLDEIEGCYMEARLPKTKNFSPYITQLIRDGILMDAAEKKDNKKAWTLTESGLKYVEGLVQEGD